MIAQEISATALLHHRISGVVTVDVIYAVSGSYQAAAMDKRTCASANSFWLVKADAIATLIRRTLMRT